MKILDFLTGEVVEERESPINGVIKVVKRRGDYRIEAGGLLQSGGLIRNIWQAGLKKVDQKVNNCLILGLGGGTAAKLVAKRWSGARIVGVEIDPVIIELAKRYFEIDKIANLEIIREEAIGWVKRRREIGEKGGIRDSGEEGKKRENNEGGFSLILVDLYVGDKFPKEAEAEEFLENLKKLLSPSGMVILNRLFWGKKKKEAENFVKLLENHFPKITLKRTPCNLLIFCSTEITS